MLFEREILQLLHKKFFYQQMHSQDKLKMSQKEMLDRAVPK